MTTIGNQGIAIPNARRVRVDPVPAATRAGASGKAASKENESIFDIVGLDRLASAGGSLLGTAASAAVTYGKSQPIGQLVNLIG